MLIDLDRSCDKKEAANRANHDGASTMYSTPDPNPRPWTADMKDWRQVGILCHFIFVDGAGDYNKLEVTLASQQYFVTLFTKGRTFVRLLPCVVSPVLVRPLCRVPRASLSRGVEEEQESCTPNIEHAVKTVNNKQSPTPSTEIARCIGVFHSRSGWFYCTEPPQTTALQGLPLYRG